MIGVRLSDRYLVSSELGRGGMGVVYRARDPLLNRDVAVKLIPPALLTPEAEQRFQREAQLVAQMDHPAIVSIFDVGRHDGSLYFVMPVVQGTSLRTCLRERTQLGDVVDVGIQVAEALEYSHARGVVHRDIKPENLMVVTDEAGHVRVRVMDFGLARAQTEARLTRSGAMVGTLSYLSPEQVAGRDVDPRTDVYSLGAVLYECVVGEPPFTGEVQTVLYRIVHEIPQPPRSHGAAIDEELEVVILTCLAKDPSARYQRAGDLAEALTRYRARLHDSDRLRSVTGFTRTFLGHRPPPSPFVARAREFGELQQRLNLAAGGESQFAVVAGPAGVGKTRLLDELETLCKARRIRVLRGRCVEHDGSFPYQAFAELIQEFSRLKDTGSGPAADLSDLAPELVSLFPMLGEIAELRSAAAGRSGVHVETPSMEDRTQVYELLARALTRMAGGRPLAVFLEDLHGAVVSIDALQYVVRRLGPTPVLIVGTYRTDEVDARHPLARMLDGFRGDRRFSLLTLGPFNPSDHRLFLETLIGGAQLSSPLVLHLHEATEGNAFFTKELVRSLLDSGGIARDESGAWILATELGLAAEALPATIQQAVEKRIAGLPDTLREILSVAAVIGRTFDARDLEKLAEASVDEALDALVRDGLVEEQRESRGDLVAFSSGVVRDVLYAGLSRRRRRSLHRRYAEYLEARNRGRTERILPQLLYHFSQGDVPDKSVEYGLQLARASLEAFSPHEAARSARIALEFLDEEWEGDRALEGEARLLLARAHRTAGDIEAALKEAEAAVRVFERERQPARGVAALLLAAETAWQARRTAETGRWVERGIEAARAAADADGLRQLLSLAATLANLLGDYEKANAFLAEVGELAPAREAEPAEEVPRGGRLVVAMPNPIALIEPVAVATNEEIEVSTNVFEPLLATDAQGNLVPLLCERWEVSEDGRRFVLTLRRGVRFSDGTPLTAPELKRCIESAIRRAPRELPAAWEAIAGQREYRSSSATEVAGLVAHGEDRVEIVLEEPLRIYPALLTEGATGVARVAAEDGAGSSVRGTGPFVLAGQDPERLVLERNADYWGSAPARVDAVEFRCGLSAAAIARAFRAGEVDVARDLLLQDLEEIQRDPVFRRGLVEAPKKNTYFVLFNCMSSPLGRRPALRRALAGILRTRDVVWQTLGRFAQPAPCLIPPGMLAHDPGRRVRSLGREEAVALLEEAGAAAPLRLRVSVHPLLQDRYGALLAQVFAAWSDLGVEVEVATTSMPSYLQTWQGNGEVDLLIGRWNADYDDPDNFTYTLFHSAAGTLRAYFSSAETDRILEDARTEARPNVREGFYRRFENVLADQAVLVPLFHDIDYRVASPRVRGLTLRGTAPYVNYAELGKVEAVEAPLDLRTAGGTLHVPLAGVVSSIDPAQGGTIEQGEVIPAVFETLTRDAGGARIVPSLAAEIRVEDGGRRYRFRLRDDVRFHDGRRLTARDVRYSLERVLQTHSQNDIRWMYASIRGARALIEGAAGDLEGFRIHSAGEFSIDLEEPISFFPAVLAFTGSAIVAEGSDPSKGSWQAGCVGTGPFRVVSFEPGRRLELERNRSYWRKGVPRCEGLVFSFGVEPKEILAGFRAGRFSLAANLFPEDAEALRREPDFASGYRESPRLITYYAAFNTRQGPLADRGLRQSLAAGVDVPRLVRQTIGRLAIPARGLIPPGLLGHDPGSARRPEGASVSAGGIELTAALHPVFFAGYSAFARELGNAFAERGFRLRAVNRTMSEWLEAVKEGSVDVAVGRWSADYPDADTFAQLVHTHGLLGRFTGSPEVDRLVERARSEPAPGGRHALYRQLEEMIAREAILLPLFHEQEYRFARPEVDGLSVTLWGRAVEYEGLRVS